MAFTSYNEKIDRYLDDLGDEYKELLLKATLANAPSFEELSIPDLLRIDSEIKEPLKRRSSKELRRKQVLYKFGILYAAIGFSGFILSLALFYLGINVLSDSLLPSAMAFSFAIVTLIGLWMALYSYFYSQRVGHRADTKREIKRDDDQLINQYKVVALWGELESIFRKIEPNGLTRSYSSTIKTLVQEGFISVEEEESLRIVLKLRNSIVHGMMEDEPTSEELDLALLSLEGVIRKLNSHVAEH